MPIQDNPNLNQQTATQPLNVKQPARFGGISELAKDTFVTELTYFLNTKYTGLRSGELPRVDKYSVAVDVTQDPLETAVSLIRTYPDVAEDLPLIAVLATTGQNKRLSISDHFTSLTVPAAQVVSTLGPGPFVLADGMTLQITSQPDGVQTYPDGTSAIVTSNFTFPSFMFADITNATLAEVVRCINFQALYAHALIQVSGPTSNLAVRAGGPQGTSFPNQITIVNGTAVIPLGFTNGQNNANFGVGKQAYDRHHICADLTVAIEVVAESENVRTELSDLLYDFLTFVMADRKYQFYGRSSFDSSILDETYQIIIKDNEISFSGEQEIPRSNDPKDKLYINRVTVPIIAIQYTDRIITNSAGSTVTPLINIIMVGDDSLPIPN